MSLRQRLVALVALLSLGLSGCAITLNDNTIKWTIGHDWLVVHHYFHLQRKATWQISVIYRVMCEGTANQRAGCTRDFVDGLDMDGVIGGITKAVIISAMDDARAAFRDQMEFIAWRAADGEDPRWCLTLDTWEIVTDRYTWNRRNLDSSDCDQGEMFSL
jgi:hypothetical protein